MLAEAFAHGGFGLVATARGDFEAATGHLEKDLSLFRESGEDGLAIQTHIWLGTVLLLQGDHEGARQRFEEGLALGRSAGDRLSICNALFNLAQLALTRGDYDAAFSRFAEGIAPSEELGDRGNVAYILEGLGIVAGARGEAGRAARLLGASEALISAIGLRGHTYYQPDRSLYKRVVDELRSRLDKSVFAIAWAQGRAMTYEEAVEYALSEKERASPTVSVPNKPPAGKPTAELTRREEKVAILVAQGLTNRQIAEELTISEYTAENHVRKILKKLELRSRVQVAAWVAEQGSLP